MEMRGLPLLSCSLSFLRRLTFRLPKLGSLEEGFAKRKVTFGQREIEEREEPRLFAYR